MSCFKGRMKEYTSVSLDRFDGGVNLSSTVFFLSHCHKDHMAGLDSSAFLHRLQSRIDIFLYCSEVTSILLMADHQYRALEKYIKILDVNTPTTIIIPDKGCDIRKTSSVLVTALSAGHCPGSVMFLFEGREGTALYTGDFRWETNHAQTLVAFKSGDSLKEIDSLYIDTTFCIEDAFHFPRRLDCVEASTHLVSRWLSRGKDHVVSISCKARYGHEHFLKELCDRTHEKVHTSADKCQVYKKIGDLGEVFTPDGSARIHSCNFVSGRSPKSRLPCGYIPDDGRDLHVLVLRPSTMFFAVHRPQYRHGDLIVYPKSTRGLHRVCYSFHSSYVEIRDLVTYLRPKRVLPNVKPPNDPTMSKVQARLDSFLKLVHRKHIPSMEAPERILGKLKVRQRKHKFSMSSQSDSEGLRFGSDSPGKVPSLKDGLELRLTPGESETSDADSSYQGTQRHTDGEEMDLCMSPGVAVDGKGEGLGLNDDSDESLCLYVSGDEDCPEEDRVCEESYDAHDDMMTDDPMKTNGDPVAANDDSVVINDDPVMTNDDSVVANDDSVVINDDPVVTNDDSVVANDDSVVANDDLVVANDDSVVINDDPVVTNDDSVVVNDDSVVANDDSVVTNDDSVLASDDSVLASDDSVVINDDPVVVNDDSVVVNDDSVVVTDDPVVTNGSPVATNDDTVIRTRKDLDSEQVDPVSTTEQLGSTRNNSASLASKSMDLEIVEKIDLTEDYVLPKNSNSADPCEIVDKTIDKGCTSIEPESNDDSHVEIVDKIDLTTDCGALKNLQKIQNSDFQIIDNGATTKSINYRDVKIVDNIDLTGNRCIVQTKKVNKTSSDSADGKTKVKDGGCERDELEDSGKSNSRSTTKKSNIPEGEANISEDKANISDGKAIFSEGTAISDKPDIPEDKATTTLDKSKTTSDKKTATADSTPARPSDRSPRESVSSDIVEIVDKIDLTKDGKHVPRKFQKTDSFDLYDSDDTEQDNLVIDETQGFDPESSSDSVVGDIQLRNRYAALMGKDEERRLREDAAQMLTRLHESNPLVPLVQVGDEIVISDSDSDSESGFLSGERDGFGSGGGDGEGFVPREMERFLCRRVRHGMSGRGRCSTSTSLNSLVSRVRERLTSSDTDASPAKRPRIDVTRNCESDSDVTLPPSQGACGGRYLGVKFDSESESSVSESDVESDALEILYETDANGDRYDVLGNPIPSHVQMQTVCVRKLGDSPCASSNVGGAELIDLTGDDDDSDDNVGKENDDEKTNEKKSQEHKDL